MLNIDHTANGGGNAGSIAAQHAAGFQEFTLATHVVCSPWEGIYLEQAQSFPSASR